MLTLEKRESLKINKLSSYPHKTRKKKSKVNSKQKEVNNKWHKLIKLKTGKQRKINETESYSEKSQQN